MKKIKVLINREGLDKYLLAHNMTLLDLANAIYIDRTYMYRLANGKCYVSGRIRELIMRHLNTEFEDIFITKEITYVDRRFKILELHISKSELNQLLDSQSKEITIGNEKVMIKIID